MFVPNRVNHTQIPPRSLSQPRPLMNTRFEEKLEAIPEIPKRFGEDGGHFYRDYDTLADEIDEEMVKSLQAQLDGILIFVRPVILIYITLLFSKSCTQFN